MAVSVFWRDLEQRFGELQAACEDSLQGGWMVSGNSVAGYQWRLQRAIESVREVFIWLADRAAIELGHTGGNGWIYWLDLLKQESPNHRGIILQECDGNRTGDRTEAGIILRLCGASAQYCIRCEGRVIAKLRRKGEASMRPAESVPQIESLTSGMSSGKAKPGPKVDIERASRISEVVAKIAPGGKCKENWEDLCEAFDEAHITVSRAWKKTGIRCWADCEDRERAVKAILHQLKVAKKKR